MGNKGSRSRAIQPEIRASKNPIVGIEVKPSDNAENQDKQPNSKCQSCKKTGNDFTVVSRDGTKITKMYYCRACSITWRD